MQTCKDFLQVTEIFIGVNAANKTSGGVLVHLPQFAGGVLKLLTVFQQRQARAGYFPCGRQIRAEQIGFGKQRLAAHGAQIIQQRQNDQRVVAAIGFYFFQVDRELQNGPHEDFLGLGVAGDATFNHCLSEAFHFLGHHGGAVEFHHLQTAVHLVNMG